MIAISNTVCIILGIFESPSSGSHQVLRKFCSSVTKLVKMSLELFWNTELCDYIESPLITRHICNHVSICHIFSAGISNRSVWTATICMLDVLVFLLIVFSPSHD